MSREVLGSGESDAEASAPSQRSRATVVTDLDAPDVPSPARRLPQAPPVGQHLVGHRDLEGHRPDGPRADVQQQPAGAQRTGPNGRTALGQDPAGVDVDLDAAGAPPGPPPTRTAQWWARAKGTPVVLVAAAAVGALLASLVTGGILQRQYAEERHATVRLLAEVMLDGSALRGGTLSGDEPVEVDLVVMNAGQDAVQVVSAALPDSRGTSIEVQDVTEVPAGAVVRVPAQVELDCGGRQPRRLEVGVRTVDGRDRTLEPGSLSSVAGGSGPLEGLWWACQQSTASNLEIWAMTARSDGTLAMHLRNPSDREVQIGFAGPIGTRIMVEGKGISFVLGGRDSEFLHLTVEVDRCTSAAQRANAADDLSLVVDGQNAGPLPADFALLSGWLARQVALVCG